MIVAVDKVDLYPEEIDQGTRVLSGRISPRSPFVQQLRELELPGRHGSFCRWEARPVCAQLDEFRWHRQTVASQLDPGVRDRYIADFLRLIASHLKK